ELLEDAVAIGHGSLIRQRIEEVHDGPGRRIDTVARYHLTRERQPRRRIPGDDRGTAEVAAPHRRGRNNCPAAAEDALVVRTFVVRVKEKFSPDNRTARARAPPVLVRVRERVAALDARE